MNIEDFNLLTQEEIDDVIQEVLSENIGKRIKNLAKGKAATAGKGNLYDQASDEEKAAADAELDATLNPRRDTARAAIPSAAAADRAAASTADAADNAAIQGDVSADPASSGEPNVPPGQIGVDQDAAGRVGGGLGDRGDPGIKSNLAYAQQTGVTSAASGDINPSRTKAASGKFGEPGVAAADGNELGGPDNIDKVETWTLTDSNWYTAGSSKTAPAGVRKRIQARYGGLDMSPEQVVSEYINARHDGDITSQMANTERKMTMAKLDALIKTAKKTKGTEQGQDHAEKVRRYLDALLALSVKEDPSGETSKITQKPGPGPDPTPGPDPDPEPGPEGEDDKGKDIPVPVNKKLSKDQRADAGLSGGAAGSLASQLAKLFGDKVDQKIITQILKDVVGQLKANNIPVQEGKRLALRLLLEHQVKSMVLLEKKPSRAQRKARSAKMRQKKDSGKWSVQKLSAGEFVGQRPSGEQKKFHQLKYQDKYGAKALQKAKEEATCWAKTGEACPEEVDNTLFDKFKETLKRLDLHTSQGRAAAKDDDQAYLGAFRYFRAMQAAFKAIKGDKLEQSTDKLMKMVEPLNEEEDNRNPRSPDYDSGSENAAGKDFRTWLANMINIFKEEGFDDKARAMAAMKAARKGRMPGSGSEAPETKADKAAAAEKEKAAGAETARRTGKAGAINIKSVVGPRLKQGGHDIAKKRNVKKGESPHTDGSKLQRDLSKVIRRFLTKQLQRIGKTDLKVIAENEALTDELVAIIKEHLS